MATIVLSSVGSALGNTLLPAGLSVFGATLSGAAIGGAIGTMAGSYVDAQLFGGAASAEGPRMSDLHVMASTEGAPIPRAYGRVRLGGHVIWATNYRERARKRSAGGGKGGGSPASVTEYSYSVSFAVALCEGEVARIGRVWADGKPLSLANATWRLHTGSETQAPDPLIEAVEGEAPAYRGTAYIVFEEMDVTGFGNRIPQLSFEVFRTLDETEVLVRAVTVIPGAGEFVYDTARPREILSETSSRAINVHTSEGKADFAVAMDQLEAALPNARAVSLVVSWFGDDLRCGECSIRPKVETGHKITSPGSWNVAGLSRGAAAVVSMMDGKPAYGGTPSDASVIRALQDLRARGLATVFYPFVMMDIPAGNVLTDPWTGDAGQPAYPWRGRITGAAPDVAAFFGSGTPGGSEWSYRRMVLHYAQLCVAAGGVDAFLIGSELKGLTQIRDGGGNYPAVAALRELAADMRAILGPGTKISYAADWSEYRGHDAGGGEFFFHLDPLWADANIDFIGIDNYAPLTDWREGHTHLDAEEGWRSIYDPGYLRSRIAGGEDFDWYYASDEDRAAQQRTPILDGAYDKPWVWRAKDLKSWWLNEHYNRPGGTEAASPTAWVPQSKPIWFTEIGCPAIDKGTNQPNVFTDPKSSESAVPRFSRGLRDDFIQRRFIEAQISFWDPAHPEHAVGTNPVSELYGGRMVEPARVFFWTWDARPFPAFPERSDIWADAENWRLGHWLNGRMGAASLPALVRALMADVGFEDFDASGLRGAVDGFVVDRIMSPRAALEPLMLARFFDAAECEGVIRFRHFDGMETTVLAPGELAVADESAVPGYRLTRGQETELPLSAKILYIDGDSEYRQAAVEARRLAARSERVSSAALPMVLTQAEAQAIADVWLQKTWSERERAVLSLPPSLLALDPGDVVTLELPERDVRCRLISLTDAGAREAAGVAHEASLFGAAPAAPERGSTTTMAPGWGTPLVIFMDLPLITGEETPHAPRVAVAADPWPGGVAIYKSAGVGFALDRVLTRQATIGRTATPLMPGPAGRWDEGNGLTVELVSGELASADAMAVLAGANAAALETPEGEWEVIQFRDAVLTAPDTYLLSGLLRGQAGTEAAMRAPLAAGARFVLLDESVNELGLGDAERGLAREWAYGPAPLPFDDPLYASVTQAIDGAGLRPLSPVHIRAAREADGTISIRWTRRTRIGGDSWQGIDVPLAEETEAYEIEIRDGDTVKRIIAASSPHESYGTAEQLADFGGTDFTSIDLTLYQLSRTYGRGTGRSVRLDV